MNKAGKFVRLALSIFIVLVMCKFAFASDAVYERIRTNEVVGWSVFALDNDIDASAELLTQLATTYAQISAEEAIEVLSSEAADTTQTVTVTGIDDSGNKCSEAFALAGATVQTSTTTFRYVDQVSVDIECAGTITVRKKTGDTLIISIPIGKLEGSVAQHFNGEDVSYITSWNCNVSTTTGSVLFELRQYTQDADCLDAGDGYKILDMVYIDGAVTSPYNVPRTFSQPIKVPAGSWICVYGLGGAANSDGAVLIQGFDASR